MELVFIDEFGCNREYKRHILKDDAYHPTRGYAGISIPAENIKEFSEDFAVLKIMALRQYQSILLDSKVSLKKIEKICPKLLSKTESPEIFRKIILQDNDADRIFSSIVSAEVKSSELLRLTKRSISSRRRFVQLFISTIKKNNGTIFFSGYEKKTINLSGKNKEQNDITLKEIEYSIEVLKKYAIVRDTRLKILFDQHSIDNMKGKPFIRKHRFDSYIFNNNLSRFFPETATIDVNSRYSLCMQAADWSCGLVSRYLALSFEPEERSRFGAFFNLKTRNLWASVVSRHSHVRHGRSKNFFSEIIADTGQTEMDV